METPAVIVIRKPGQPVLVNREALARLAQRPIPTIRVHCVVVRYRGRTPLYDLHAELARLERVPRRRRDADRLAG